MKFPQMVNQAIVITQVIYSYGGRRNGWYCYPATTEGYQIGNAQYMYQKAELLKFAKNWANKLSVKVVRM